MTKIQWTQETVSPFVGCTKVSAGCSRCYAEKMAKRLCAMGQEKYFPVVTPNGWNGKTNFDPSALAKIFKWKTPRMIFMVSMGDLFHEDNDNEDIAMVFAAMFLNQRHTFQVLTKRPERAKEILKSEGFMYSLHAHCNKLHNDHIQPLEQELYFFDEVKDEWPLKNVWFGVTAENQEMANLRLPSLFHIPAAKRFVSIEPQLGPVDLSAYYFTRQNGDYAFPYLPEEARTKIINLLDWVICGCESGTNRRPFEFDWAVSLRDQCVRAGVPFFFKQRYIGSKKISLPTIDNVIWNQIPER